MLIPIEWFHGRCVGVSPTTVTEHYFCTACASKRRREAEARKAAKEKADAETAKLLAQAKAAAAQAAALAAEVTEKKGRKGKGKKKEEGEERFYFIEKINKLCLIVMRVLCTCKKYIFRWP